MRLLTANPKHIGGIQEAPIDKKQKKEGTKKLTRPHLKSNPLKKLIKELGSSSIHNLDQDHKLQIKEYFIIWIERSSFSKATLFLSF